MSGFSETQSNTLSGKLPRRHVQTREMDGRSIDYIEGWFAIAQANKIFGFAGWDRETTHFERLFERSRADATSCAYLARVRIRVRAGETTIIREGTGTGSATAPNTGDAHERALKAAETDATKRALATFGNRFGLALYDKEQNGVTGRKTVPTIPSLTNFIIIDPTGELFAKNLTPESFCAGLRQLIQIVAVPGELESLARHNKPGLARLRQEASSLRTAKRVHYADILERMIKDRLTSSTRQAAGIPLPSSASLAPSRIAPGPRIDKSVLTIGTERRLRDKAHLKFVGSHPCLVCGRQPCHAHHLTFAQPRGLSMKVSDEFTVPLCAVHHDELHRFGPERKWWERKAINPELIAAELWGQGRDDRPLGDETSPASPRRIQTSYPDSSTNGSASAPEMTFSSPHSSDTTVLIAGLHDVS